MAGNQQFCLRWNNHQSTLISVFDNLLESGTLVDCTLAAEGQYLRAHKVVLSACSPFFEGLFSQHYESHPIIILKDVTFGELKAMLDYMYRGEVNISQDQLGTFLKAAESLQIKGLTEKSGNNGDVYGGGGGGGGRRSEQRRVIMPPMTAAAKMGPGFPLGLVVEPRAPIAKCPPNNNNVESPPRRKRRLSDEDSGGGSVMNELPPLAPQCMVTEGERPLGLNVSGGLLTTGASATAAPVAAAATAAVVRREATETILKNDAVVKTEPNVSPKASSQQQSLTSQQQTSRATPPPPASTSSAPDQDQDSSQDAHSYQDQEGDDDEEEMDLSKPGTSSHPNSHTPGSWNMSSDNPSGDDSYPPGGSQEQGVDVYKSSTPNLSYIVSAPFDTATASASRPPLLSSSFSTLSSSSSRHKPKRSHGVFPCDKCGRTYVRKDSLQRHVLWECGKDPMFQCPFCPQRCKRKSHHVRHMQRQHKDMLDLMETAAGSVVAAAGGGGGGGGGGSMFQTSAGGVVASGIIVEGGGGGGESGSGLEDDVKQKMSFKKQVGKTLNVDDY